MKNRGALIQGVNDKVNVSDTIGCKQKTRVTDLKNIRLLSKENQLIAKIPHKEAKYESLQLNSSLKTPASRIHTN